MSENEIEVPEDYTEEEKRQDMLCYSTDPLEKDVVITGDITVSLYIASDAPDTDFMVRLTDVDENGRSIKLADGILSAKYRNGFDHADFLNPGEVVPLTILTTKISNCFKKGHRIRVTITSSAKNFVFPNSNTKDGFNSQTTVVAHNTIFHGGQYPSKITVVWSSKAFSNFANRVSVFQMSASCLFAKIVLKKVTANKEIVYN